MHTATDTERNVAAYYFHEGTSARAHEFLGARRTGEQVVFRVFAPHAESVSVCGDFTDWNPDLLFMRRITENGVWEITVRGDWIADGQRYKYVIRNGRHEHYRADPYATDSEPNGTASVIASTDAYAWRDSPWLAWRRKSFAREAVKDRPIHIYKLHAGSWMRHANGSPYRYGELARELVSYAKQMGYTHVELMAEQPEEGTRTAGYFSPASRHGTSRELMALIDTMHEAGIGVLLDFGDIKIPSDEHGIGIFDGEPLYEAAWGDDRLDLSRREVQSLLLSSAVFWIERYHADGLCIDTASLLGKDPSPDARAFVRRLLSHLATEYPDVITVAASPTDGVLDLALTCDGGSLEKDLDDRGASLACLARLLSEPSASRVLTLDGAKGEDMPHALARVLLTSLMTLPGKKRTFMGTEIGQLRGHDPVRECDWFLLNSDAHASFQLFAAELNRLYLESPALWRCDGSSEDTALFDVADADEGILSYTRRDGQGDELTVVLNLSPTRREEHPVRVASKGFYEEILNSDRARFGGEGYTNPGRRHAEQMHCGGEIFHAVHVSLPPMGALILRRVRRGSLTTLRSNCK